MGSAATAQSVPVDRFAPRPVVLTETAGEASLIYLAPGAVTLILLDAPIVPESVEVDGRERFARVDPWEQSITLALAVPLEPTERLALRFTYREGVPSSGVLLLTGKPGKADSLVSVSRPPLPEEACHVELSSTRERCEAQRKELEALKARPLAVSPAAVALSELVDDDGMVSSDISKSCSESSGELLVGQCLGLGASTWSVATLKVSNHGPEPWMPAWAEVTPAAGGPPRPARVVLAMQVPIPPGGTARVAIEVQMPSRKRKEWLKAPHVLRVCDTAGSRCLSFAKVTL